MTKRRGSIVVADDGSVLIKSNNNGTLSAKPDISINPGESVSRLTPLMRACRRGKVDRVLAVLTADNLQIENVDNHGRTAMHHCVQRGQLECAKMLLKLKPTIVNVADSDGLTPLHIAIITGEMVLTEFLVNSGGANVNAADREGHSLVHWAVVSINAPAINLLATAGADLNRRDPFDATAIHYAVQVKTPAIFSASNNSVTSTTSCLEALIALKAPCNVKDRIGRTPLMWAAASGNAQACWLLVDKGKADVASIDNDGASAVHYAAAARGQMETLEVLIDKCHANVDMLDANLCTPLFYTAATGNVQALSFLISRKADANHVDKKGRTVSHVAASRGNVRIIKELVSLGADMWTQSNRGDLPLHEALLFGQSEELITVLLDLRSNMVNARNSEGRTCLHIAAANNNVQMCKMLIKYGANVNDMCYNSRSEGQFSNKQFLTAFDCANSLGYTHCAKTIKLHGGAPAATLLNMAAVRIQRRVRNFVLKQPSRRGSSVCSTNSSNTRPPISLASLATSSIVDLQRAAADAKQTVRTDSIGTVISNTSRPSSAAQNVLVVGTVALFKDPEDDRWHVTAPPLASRRSSVVDQEAGLSALNLKEMLQTLPLSSIGATKPNSRPTTPTAIYEMAQSPPPMPGKYFQQQNIPTKKIDQHSLKRQKSGLTHTLSGNNKPLYDLQNNSEAKSLESGSEISGSSKAVKSDSVRQKQTSKAKHSDFLGRPINQ